MAGIVDAAIDSGKSVGRHFSIVSMVPTTLFVLYIAGLLVSGAWSGPFKPEKITQNIAHPTLQGLAALVVVSLLLGVALHPFQFPMTQLLEGYWGGSMLALALASRRVVHYRRVASEIEDVIDRAEDAWKSGAVALRGAEAVLEEPLIRRRRNRHLLDSEPGDPLMGDYLRAQAARAARSRYPDAGRRFLPTRFGNVLRRYEDRAGRQYELDVLVIAPHLNLVAQPDRRAYLDDTRQQMDLAVRLCVLSLLAAGISVALLADDGAWLLLALAPYAMSYLAYRGAIASAHAYGTALSTVLDLDRFSLYQELHAPIPADIAAERKNNRALLQIIGNEARFIRYEHPLPPTS